MRALVLFAGMTLLFSAPATAQNSFSSSDAAVIGSLAFDQGGIAIGADYEYNYHRTYGLGGFFRMTQQDDGDAANGEPGQNGITAVGGFIRPHFNRRMWDFSVAPGFAFTSEDDGDDSEMAIGPSLMTDLLYQLNSDIAIGAEWMVLSDWFNKAVANNFHQQLNFRFRYNF